MSDITKDTFQKAKVATKFDMLFDIVTGISETQQATLKKCDTRFKVLEVRKIKDTAFSGVSGMVGGVLAVIGKTFLK